MEAINSVVNTASKAIWGEQQPVSQSGQEPLSGQKGAGTAEHPYDRGNEEITTQSVPTAESSDGAGIPGGDHARTHHTEAGQRSGDIRPSEANEDRPNTNVGGFGTAEPSVGVAPSSGGVPHQKQEGADRPTEAPNAEQTYALRQKKESGEATQTGEKKEEHHQHYEHKRITSEEEREKLAEKGELPHDPNDHSGEPLKMHSGSENKADEDVTSPPKDRAASVAHEGGGEHGKVKGTGEQYVKSSGLAADGGDFDATKPGAGSEANRLLEAKGIHKDDKGKLIGGDDEGSPTPSDGKKPKGSKMEKLKEKLHIGTGKNLG